VCNRKRRRWSDTQFSEAVKKKRWLPELRMSSDNMLTMKISNEQRTRIFYREKLLKKKQLNTEWISLKAVYTSVAWLDKL
jgi:hypothetical protein